MVDVVDPVGWCGAQAIEADPEPLFRVTMNEQTTARPLPESSLLKASARHPAHRPATDDTLPRLLGSAISVSRPCRSRATITTDLEARFGLEPEFLRRAARRQHLCDRDDKAVFPRSTAAPSRRLLL